MRRERLPERRLRALTDRCFVRARDEAIRYLGDPLDFADECCRVMLGMQIAHHATLLPAPSAKRAAAS